MSHPYLTGHQQQHRHKIAQGEVMSQGLSIPARLKRGLTAVLLWLHLAALPAQAHEVTPAITNMQVNGDTVTLSIRANLEGFLAGINLGATGDTNAAPQAADYDMLRALPSADLQSRFEIFFAAMQKGIVARSDKGDIPLKLVSVAVPEVGTISLPRASVIELSGKLPGDARTAVFGWDAGFGAMVFRQNGVSTPYDGYLKPGELTPPITLLGGSGMTSLESFLSYIPVGFDHIVPKGLDHILFVLGLFFLSPRAKPLLWQISLFTVAHTVTLALGATGLIVVPAQIVEPIIAASIVFVAVENIRSDCISRWRPAIVFGFGLLHGLGFAAVLQEFGLPDDGFFAALIGFNIGVELGQVFVIGVAFLVLGLWFRTKPWYRRRISTPASALIALVGAFWFVERSLQI
jgi:hypothetical protein